MSGLNGGEFFIVIFILIYLALFVVYFEIHSLTQKKYINIVLNHSKKLEFLKEINSRYSFEDIEPLRYERYVCNSLAQFRNFSFDNYMKKLISENMVVYDAIVDATKRNVEKYQKYLEEVNSISCPVTLDEYKKLGIPEKEYKKHEELLFSNEQLTPVTNPKVKIDAFYTSPAGRNSYKNSRTYGLTDIMFLQAVIANEDSHKQTTDYQRSLMTPGLRMRILKRDNYRCQICGRTAQDGITLEVDHIVPVSKGGKTVEPNLQTLCRDCNRGKSNIY